MAHRASPIRGMISDAFGVRGRRNLMAWAVAGGIAYYLYIVPERKRDEEQQRVREQARQWAEAAAAAAEQKK
ncbi:hypothetical protein D9Q98_009205 [Chlorella vulgaris]|uniref:Uncharacterized protein n=1 Tax=Chlorella vulgaris TaxID=3077 RepID=A0A9D4TP08_CHLVU|nr:hypothetical protein D9Q98_009205 [Chlorella vulgaris]